MKQYDRIFVPCPQDKATNYVDEIGPVEYEVNVIVCTIRELQELWVAGSISEYLQSKGITLTPNT